MDAHMRVRDKTEARVWRSMDTADRDRYLELARVLASTNRFAAEVARSGRVSPAQARVLLQIEREMAVGDTSRG